MKGLPDPIELFELTGAGTARTRLQAAVFRGLTRFVGRDAEVEHLRRVLGQAGAGRGQVVAIVGEAGVGKSRFYEFTHPHRVQDRLVMDAASVSYGKATSYLPVIDLLEGYFQNRGPGRSPEDARLRLDAFPPEGANELLRTLWRVTTVSSTACRSRASRERADD